MFKTEDHLVELTFIYIIFLLFSHLKMMHRKKLCVDYSVLSFVQREQFTLSVFTLLWSFSGGGQESRGGTGSDTEGWAGRETCHPSAVSSCWRLRSWAGLAWPCDPALLLSPIGHRASHFSLSSPPFTTREGLHELSSIILGLGGVEGTK